MTEAEWLTSSKPRMMLASLSGKAKFRKQGLFALAAFSLVQSLLASNSQRANEDLQTTLERIRVQLDDVTVHRMYFWATAPNIHSLFENDPRPAVRRAVEAYEALLDWVVSGHQLDFESEADRINWEMNRLSELAGHVERALTNTNGSRSGSGESAPRRAQANLLRDIFGNPFRPVIVDPAWLTSTVVSLATAIYEERAFDRLPILADALEDAGCTNADILHHCRQPGEHVLGCWRVDSVLGKQ